MLQFFRALLNRDSTADRSSRAESVNEILGEPPKALSAPDGATYPFEEQLIRSSGLPFPDWNHFQAWLDTLPDAQAQEAIWSAAEIGWMQHLCRALGGQYRLLRHEHTLMLSTLDTSLARATFETMATTGRRVERLLLGIAQVPSSGHAILILLDDEETYYRYVAYFYPEGGEFATSGGMHISAGCSHFVTRQAELRLMEPTIAHEMTHSYVSHLPLPAWLNEGIAVSTEERICPRGAPLYTPQEMHEKHLAFWGPHEIQQFWSGKSFERIDDGNLLSYDLARILVAHMAANWDTFRTFVLAANNIDAGASAAFTHLGIDLGIAAASLMEKSLDDEVSSWAPNPSLWDKTMERAESCGA